MPDGHASACISRAQRADGSSATRSWRVSATSAFFSGSAGLGDDRSVKIKSLEAAKIMKIRWLVLGCIEADFLQVNIRWKALDLQHLHD